MYFFEEASPFYILDKAVEGLPRYNIIAALDSKTRLQIDLYMV